MAAVVTLLFTDLVGSTEMLDRIGDDAAESVRRTHFRILREAVAGAGGEEVKNLGDGLMVAFESAVAAVECAAAIQRGVERHNRSHPGRCLAVRVGLHVGEPIRDEDDYFGTPVVVAKRLCDAAGGGQILASDLVRGLVGRRAGVAFDDIGSVSLRGLAEPLPAYQVRWDSRPAGTRNAGPADPRSVRFVGREPELRVLEDELVTAAAGRLRVVLVTGEAGIGKTSLAGELLARHAGEVIGLSARAYPLGATASLGLWVEALERHLRSLDAHEVADLCGPGASDVAALLPAVTAAGVTPPAAEPPRVRLLGGLAALLTQLSAGAPLLVLLDDVHWADGSSWEALNYLVHNLADQRILIVLAARPAELAAQSTASQALLGLEQEGFLRRRPLAPFGADGIRALAVAFAGEDRVGSALVDWLMERSAGTPLFAAGLLRCLIDEGADLSQPALSALPEDLAERIEVRVGQLDAASRAVLELVAVAGSRITLGELLALTGHPLERLADLLEGLVRLRFVVELDQGRDLIYEMAHPLIGEAVYGSLGGARRRALHRHVARALVASGRAGPAAAHFVASAEVGDPEAVGALREALAQATARELHREALALLQALLELLPAGDRRWADVVDDMALQPEWIVDHRADTGSEIGAEAMRRIDQVLARDPTGDPARRAAVKLNLAVFLAWGMGEVTAAFPLAEEARRLFGEAGGGRAEMLAQSEIGYLHWLAVDMTTFEAVAGELRHRATEAGDDFVVLQSMCALLFCTQLGGRTAASLSLADEALDLARRTGRLYRTSYLLGQGALSLGLLGRLPEALARVEEGKAVNPASRDGFLLEFAMNLHWLGGSLDTCLDTFREQLAWTGAYSRRRAWGGSIAAMAAAERGDLETARSMLAAMRELFGDRPWLLQTDLILWAQVIVSLLGGDGAGPGVDVLVRAIRSQIHGGWPEGPYTRMMVADLGEIAAQHGDTATAAIVDDLVGRVDLWGGGDPLAGLTLFALGGAAFARGDHEGSMEHLTAATGIFEVAGWLLFAARALALRGRAAAAGGDREAAVEAMTRAAERFAACGAVVRRGWILEDLRRLGARGRRAGAAVSGPAALTKREREVARLAAEGRTAKEIAAALYIAERTAETHLASAYSKLGVSSRLELARLGDLGG